MNDLYLDSSALVKLLIEEAGTQETRDLVQTSSGRLFASELQRLEVRSAIIRRYTAGDLTDDTFQRALAAVQGILGLFTLIPVTAELLTLGIGLLTDTKLRTLDTLQLASALFIADPEASITLLFSYGRQDAPPSRGRERIENAQPGGH